MSAILTSALAWSLLLAAAGLFFLYLSEKRIWWAWVAQILAQIPWLAYALGTGQWGFLLLAVAHGVLGFRDGFRWRKANRKRIPDLTIRFPPKDER